MPRDWSRIIELTGRRNIGLYDSAANTHLRMLTTIRFQPKQIHFRTSLFIIPHAGIALDSRRLAYIHTRAAKIRNIWCYCRYALTCHSCEARTAFVQEWWQGWKGWKGTGRNWKKAECEWDLTALCTGETPSLINIHWSHIAAVYRELLECSCCCYCCGRWCCCCCGWCKMNPSDI